MKIIGIDIGGANTKACDSDGNTLIEYSPLWKGDEIYGIFEKIRKKFVPDTVGVVITGELSDRFASKEEGILEIARWVKRVFNNPMFMDIYGDFHENVNPPMNFAAANFVASAKFLALEYPDAILVDMGSTTTDIIPVVGGKIVAGKSDFDRLKKGELIYFGILRTSLSWVLPEVHLRNSHTIPTSPEYFSIMADAFLSLGRIDEKEYICETPDGRGKTREDCLRRIARVVCSDLDEIGEDVAIEIARQAEQQMENTLVKALTKMTNQYNLNTVIGMGIGEFLIEKVVETANLRYISMARRYGREVSKVFPAFAVAKLIEAL
jgi:hypothetical protein